MPHGVHRGRIVSFLMSCLRPAAQDKYLQQHQSFSNELLARGLDINELPEEELAREIDRTVDLAMYF